MIEAALATDPRWWAIIGLTLDIVGAVLLAVGAWPQVKVMANWEDPPEESTGDLQKRRRFIKIGCGVLAVGFGLQIVATWMQM